jgi:hypothetical protein
MRNIAPSISLSIVFFFFFSSIFSGCKEVLEDPLTGTYEGTSSYIQTKYPCFPCIFEEKPTIDSGVVAVRFTVERDRDQSNRYIVYGLTRLERGPFRQDDYQLVPRKQGFTINTSNSSGRTQGEATLKGRSIRMNYSYTYRNIQQIYQVKGRKLY